MFVSPCTTVSFFLFILTFYKHICIFYLLGKLIPLLSGRTLFLPDNCPCSKFLLIKLIYGLQVSLVSVSMIYVSTFIIFEVGNSGIIAMSNTDVVYYINFPFKLLFTQFTTVKSIRDIERTPAPFTFKMLSRPSYRNSVITKL